MKGKNGFAIPLAMIIAVSLAVVVSSALVISTVNIRSVGTMSDRLKAFNLAEAGLHKAIWYLSNDPAEGGMGSDWRTSGLTESLGNGSYTIVVEDQAGGMKITSTGSFRGQTRIVQVLASVDFGTNLLNVTLFSGSNVGLQNLSQVNGNVYADGNVNVPAGAKIRNGHVAVTPGHAVTGDGEYSVADPSLIPEMPVLDTTFYDQEIATAVAGGPGVEQGYQTFENLNLNGSTIYVNGGVTVTGSILGPGAIISTGIINIEKGTNIGENVKLVANGNLNLKTTRTDTPTFGQGTVLYSNDNINMMSNFINTNEITIIGVDNVYIGNNSNLTGIIYGGNVIIGNNSSIDGIAICTSDGLSNTIDDSTTLTYKKPSQDVPPGFAKRIVIDEWLKK